MESIFQIFPANGGNNQKFILLRVDGRGPQVVSDHRRDTDFPHNDGIAMTAATPITMGAVTRITMGAATRISAWRQRFPRLGANPIRCTALSDDMGRAWCPADARSRRSADSSNAAKLLASRQTWGSGKRGIWVDRGCRADFQR